MTVRNPDGAPNHAPTPETLAQVIALARFGIRQDEIAAYIGIDPKTLRKHYRQELDVAMTDTNVKVASSLFKNATEKNNVQAQMFWMKTKGGWKDTSAVEVSSPDGSMSPKSVDSTLVQSLVNKLTD